jgi:glucan biosynthesis protein C
MHNLSIQKLPVDASSAEMQSEGRDIAIDYLRAFVIVLVVFLHAALAYTSFSTFDPTRWVDASAPVVDVSRWPFLDLFVLFFDTFMMPLLFLISGLFTISGLERKGSKRFFLARLQRLGIPFVITAIFFAPLAFLPGFLSAIPGSQVPYLVRFYTSDGWPVGAPWFLWILLMFDGILALVHRIAPTALARLHRQPTNLVIFLVTVVSFLPLRVIGSHYWWISLGPFDMQPIRIGLYFAYFLLGAALGTRQQWRETGWPKHWGIWFIAGILAFFAYIFVDSSAIRFPELISRLILGITWATSCAGASLGLLGAFRKFVRRRHTLFDSLSANSYGIYLIHYVLVHWIQFALLSFSWPAWIKFPIAFIGGLALSWGISKLIRQIPIVRRVL